MKMKKSKQNYEKYLNSVSCPSNENVSRRMSDRYGTWLRRNDPIQFQVGYNEWSYGR